MSDLSTENAKLRAEVERLKGELRSANANNHQRNLELDALHYVWCDGGCESGVHRYSHGPLTEDLVAAAERNTRRMRTWLENAKTRAALNPAPEGEVKA